MKRIFDFTLALVGMVGSFPLWAVIALGVWLEDRGRIFFRYDSVGKYGRIFQTLKFRSTRLADEEGVVMACPQKSSEVTRIGRLLRRTAMDELPQLWNILKGEMSFVGPSPLKLVDCDNNDSEPRGLWEIEGFVERSSVKPGLTGMAQILLPFDAKRQEKFKHDVWYAKNHSFWLDLRIILHSFFITSRGGWKKEEMRFALPPILWHTYYGGK